MLEKVNPNEYRLKLPVQYRTSDVFNVKHLITYVGDNSCRGEIRSDSRANLFQKRENGGDKFALSLFTNVDPLLRD